MPNYKILHQGNLTNFMDPPVFSPTRSVSKHKTDCGMPLGQVPEKPTVRNTSPDTVGSVKKEKGFERVEHQLSSVC